MSKLNKAMLLDELQRRAALPKGKVFSIEEHCFDKQINFIRDSAKKKTAVCSRRAGKTEACAADMINTGLTYPRTVCLYVTLTRTSAEKILWPIILGILDDYKIEHKVNNKELSVKLTNGSKLYVSGAKDKQEVEKFRGMSIKLAYVDEAQSFKNDIIKYLINDVLGWAMKDVAGTICITGTPGPVPAGYFYDLCHNPKISNHKWTMADNPWIERKSGMSVEDILLEERLEKGIRENDPTYMREALGVWTKDDNARVYRFDSVKNIYETLPANLNYIFGIDIGYKDADAIAVIGYSYIDTNVYLVEEYTERKQNITDLVSQIKYLQDKYKPIKMVMDAGALGKKIQDEIRTRHGIPVDKAEKDRKFEFIELLNDDLRTGRFKAMKTSKFEQDANVVIWDWKEGSRRINENTHTDIGDAILYAWREAKHYFPKEAKYTKPDKNSNSYMDELEQKEMDAAKNKIDGNIDDWGADDEDLFAVFDVYDDTGHDEF